MKHVFTSAGLLALGAISLHAYDPQLTRQQTGRPWSISGTVRGFYDDNVTTSPDRVITVLRRGFGSGGGGEETQETQVLPTPNGGRISVTRPRDSFGVEVSPSAHLNLPLEQTFISLGYIYSLKWYDDRPHSDIDQSHEFNGKVRHQFSPRHDLGIDDSFVLTSEPTVADRFGIITAPTRTESDVLHNRGAIEDNIGLSQQLGLSLGYVNNWYDYEQENLPGGFGSRSALLDRIEQLFRADARYQINPTLVGLVGYTFGINNYTGGERISPALFAPSGRFIRRALKSADRDSTTHRLYVGADHDITAKLRTSIRVGGEFADFHHAGESSVSPYADASVTYVYLPGSSVDLGVRHTRNATDISAVDAKGTPTLDAETTVVYAQISHRITRALTGSLLGQYQTSEFNDGANDARSEDMYLVGVNFDYRFNEHFAAEIGYNFDLLDSEIRGRSYDRNRAYIGLRATY